MPALLKKISKVKALPLLAPLANSSLSPEALDGFLRCQRLSQKAAYEVGSLIQEGWTEIQAAKLLKTYLMDSGVRAFFHYPFAWFGERTKFVGVKNYAQYSPSRRCLLPGEVFILDAAPIHHGYIADIGFTSSLGENRELEKAKLFLSAVRGEIPKLFSSRISGSKIWNQIDQKIKEGGYSNVHQKYPFSVLGHRVHETQEALGFLKVLNFGWQSFWTLGSRGIFGQLLNANHEGDLNGLWAIEPHIGTSSFGAKFEELLIVDAQIARWLEPTPQYGKNFL
jgi:Xaa-Pro aminopeptidase